MRRVTFVCVLAGCSVAPVADAGNDAFADAGVIDAPVVMCGPQGATTDGVACNCDSECSVGAVCYPEAESGYPGGVCARRCRSGPCAPGAACWDRRGICAIACDAAGVCGAGRRCDFLDGFCTAWCTSDGDCGAQPCDRYRGICDVPRTDGGGVLATCASSAECRSGLCLPGTGCLTFCEIGREGCPSGSRCLAGADGLGFCAPSCRDLPCPPHLVCGAVASDGEPLCGLPP